MDRNSKARACVQQEKSDYIGHTLHHDRVLKLMADYFLKMMEIVSNLDKNELLGSF